MQVCLDNEGMPAITVVKMHMAANVSVLFVSRLFKMMHPQTPVAHLQLLQVKDGPTKLPCSNDLGGLCGVLAAAHIST